MSFSSAEYVALYTYESSEHDVLTFQEGDMILVSQREGEWWNGSIGDRIGVFPSNYVKPKETDVRINHNTTIHCGVRRLKDDLVCFIFNEVILEVLSE